MAEHNIPKIIHETEGLEEINTKISWNWEKIADWWQAEGTLGIWAREDGYDREFSITQVDEPEFLRSICDFLRKNNIRCIVTRKSALVNARDDIRKVINNIKPYVILEKRKRNIEDYERKDEIVKRYRYRRYITEPVLL